MRQCNNGGKKKLKRSILIIPDFGGFLVKANSEGSQVRKIIKEHHADGANMLADALLHMMELSCGVHLFIAMKHSD